MPIRAWFLLGPLALTLPLLGGCSPDSLAAMTTPTLAPVVAAQPERHMRIHALIQRYAADYHLPETLVSDIVERESGYNPDARNGPYWGLMQIALPTARTMGFEGAPAELLDAETNLKYAVKYLAGAYLVAGGDSARAKALYRSGYYYDAKRQGLLAETGLASL